jgi:hypothetical protein
MKKLYVIYITYSLELIGYDVKTFTTKEEAITAMKDIVEQILNEENANKTEPYVKKFSKEMIDIFCNDGTYTEIKILEIPVNNEILNNMLKK